MSPRILCYAPYNRWALHGKWEMTILQAAMLRGAEVDYVACDGLFTDCDQFWAATEPRHARSCTECQAMQAKLIHEMGMDYTWLGRYLQLEERDAARDWARAVPFDELETATYGDFEVAEWIRGSMHSHFRTSKLDLSDPRVENTFRSYLFSGLVACFALDRLLQASAPDVLFLFNGRQSSTRVALELARRHGIRVVTHERGPRNETLGMWVDHTCVSLEPYRRLWRDWGEVPLTADELETMDRFLWERAHGINLGFVPYNTDPQAEDELFARLGLDPQRPLWALFTSSDDEISAEREWQGSFPSQLDWIQRTIDFAGRHPELQLVVRVHPNTGSKRSVGANVGQLRELTALGDRLPENVRLILPDEDLSSYTLMDAATVGLVYASTVGIELACKGKATLIAAPSAFSGLPFAHTVLEPERYEAKLEELRGVAVGTVSPEVRRLAYRMAYATWFRNGIDFPLVTMPHPSTGVLQWAHLDQLQPGRDAGLDRAVRVLIDGEDVLPAPSAEVRARSDADETRFFARRLSVLAFADELVDDPALLSAWGTALSGADPVTLVIQADGPAMERLVEAVTAAGLTGDDAADLLAFDPAASSPPPVDAAFSRRPLDGPLAVLPRYDDTSVRGVLGLAA